MKRIVVVDDRPWKLQRCIKNLQSKGVSFYKMIYYPNNAIDQSTRGEMLINFKKSTGIEVEQVHEEREFLDKMNELYNIPDLIFLMDYDLKGDMNKNDFFTRINVRYALAKNEEGKRIWFYTSGPGDIKGMLLDTFPDHVISMPKFTGGQTFWDEEQVLAAVEAEE